MTASCVPIDQGYGTVEMSRKKKIQITLEPDISYPDIWNIGKKIPCIFCQLLSTAVLDLSRFYCSPLWPMMRGQRSKVIPDEEK